MKTPLANVTFSRLAPSALAGLFVVAFVLGVALPSAKRCLGLLVAFAALAGASHVEGAVLGGLVPLLASVGGVTLTYGRGKVSSRAALFGGACAMAVASFGLVLFRAPPRTIATPTFEATFLDAMRSTFPASIFLPAALTPLPKGGVGGGSGGSGGSQIQAALRLSLGIAAAAALLLRAAAAHTFTALPPAGESETIAFVVLSLFSARPTALALTVSAMLGVLHVRDLRKNAPKPSAPTHVASVPANLRGTPAKLDALTFEGWQFTSPTGARLESPPSTRDFFVTAYFTVRAPLDGYCTFIHLDHKPARFADETREWGDAPMRTWRPGDVIADHHHVRVPVYFPADRYPLFFGVGVLPCTSDERMHVLEGDHDGNHRIRAGVIDVR